MNYIYGYKNKINNKWYVGQTSMPIEERHRLHISGATHEKANDYNCLFHKKIREYGINNFELEILEEVPNKSDLDEREQYWIEKKNSFVKNGKGYNLTTGGQYRKDNENYVDIRAKFQTQEEINQIIKEIKNLDNSLVGLAEKYQVSLSLICLINSGKKYHQDNEKYPLRALKTKISDNIVKEIIILLKENYTNKEIADLFQIDDNIVYRINYGKAHKQNDEIYPIRKELSKKEKRANKIKELLKENKLNNREIAELVKCDPSVVSNINYGKSYRDNSLNYPIRPKKNKTCIDYPRIGGVELLLIRSSKWVLLIK